MFAGASPAPAGCDGVNTPCTYPPIATTTPRLSKGEVSANIDQLLVKQFNDSTIASVHTDQAPAFWLNGNPGQNDPTTRQYARHLMSLTIQDPYANNATIPLMIAIADYSALQMLHMVTADPLRTPTLVGFDTGEIFGGVGAVTTSLPGCAGASVCTNPSFAWNHGGINAIVRQTWSGMVGPGVKQVGVDSNTWADHVDTRATMFALLGLQDDYAHDGRILVENLDPTILPAQIQSNLAAYQNLATAYKQLTAPFGTASTAGLAFATASLKSGSPQNDYLYLNYQKFMQSYLASRDPLIAQIKGVLNGAAAGQSFSASQAAVLATQAKAVTGSIIGVASLLAPNSGTVPK